MTDTEEMVLIVGLLRRGPPDVWSHPTFETCRKAADLLEQQAARIAELEKMYQLVECERADDIAELEAENARLRELFEARGSALGLGKNHIREDR